MILPLETLPLPGDPSGGVVYLRIVLSPSLINVNNDNSVEIKKRILLANKGFYGLKGQFRSQFLSINKVQNIRP
jgi:hypothetical protein